MADPTQRIFAQGVLTGLSLGNGFGDPVNDINIYPGSAVDIGQSDIMTLDSSFGAPALTKQLDSSWAAGTNAGGLDGGSIGNNWYHVWLIQRPDTGAVDVLFSLSPSTPSMPTNYTLKCRIGAFLRAAGSILTFIQIDDEFWFYTPISDLDTTEGTTLSSRTVSVPGGINALWYGTIYTQRSSANSGTYLYSPFMSDDAAQFTAPVRLTAGLQNTGGTTVGVANGNVEIRTGTSSNIKSVSTAASTTIRLTTRGWKDPRGKY